jgi:hypothetical protein
MALSADQRRLVERHLSVRTGEELDPPTCTITVTKQQLAFLIEAIDQFKAARCPVEGHGVDGCQLLSWMEDPATGAIEAVCPNPCTSWRDHLIKNVVPRAFPIQVVPA